MTGESMPVPKRPGSPVYAGTVAEEGECVIRVEKAMGSGRYDRIVHMIEESEKLKSTAEDKAARLADRLVPYTLGGTALTYAHHAQRDEDARRADGGLLLRAEAVDADRRALRDAREQRAIISPSRADASWKRSRNADTIVFDKTGTLTYATPTVAQVIPFGGYREEEMLRLAACLEEHYPHSMANAVVEEARKRGTEPRGISFRGGVCRCARHLQHGRTTKRSSSAARTSSLRTRAASCRRARMKSSSALPAEYSHLYLCIAGKLAAVICIFDPLRTRGARRHPAPCMTAALQNVVMMTGDNRHTAASPSPPRSAWTRSTPRSCPRTRPTLSDEAKAERAARSSWSATA